MRPAYCLAGRRDFIIAQWRTMHFFSTGGIRRTFANNRATAYQGRAAPFPRACFGLFNGLVNSGNIMAVYIANHVPAIAFKALGCIVGKPVFHLSVDGNAVIVVENNQFRQFQRTGQRACFVGDAFHQAAVTYKCVGEMIDHRMAFAIELTGQQCFSQRHAHGIANTLPQRPRGRFHAWRDANLRVAWRA